jgi:hypothetical protein
VLLAVVHGTLKQSKLTSMKICMNSTLNRYIFTFRNLYESRLQAPIIKVHKSVVQEVSSFCSRYTLFVTVLLFLLHFQLEFIMDATPRDTFMDDDHEMSSSAFPTSSNYEELSPGEKK